MRYSIMVRVICVASAIAAENASRSRYKTSVREESSMKLTKKASICRSPEKNRVFSDLA